ncbi:Poly(A) polymerase central domain-containing protein [Xylariaceae sp. FL0255]|nr:Poly(A) polymerase central domain-containing protein [Xylariaceae sp. FL0255]
MSFFFADEASLDSHLEQRQHSTLSTRSSDPRKSLRSDSASVFSHTSQSQPSPSLPSPLFQPSISRPITPIMLDPSCAASAASSPSSRRNSLTASLSDIAVSMDADSTADLAATMLDSGSAPQLIMPSIKMPSRRPFTATGKSLGRLKILVAGDSGVGKTSLLKAIVQSCDHIVHIDPIAPNVQSETNVSQSTVSVPSSGRAATGTAAISEIYASTKAYPEWWAELGESRSHRRKSLGDSVLERNICFVDTPGYGSESSVMEAITPCVEYVESYFNKVSSDTLSDSDILNLLGGDGGSQVDVIVYLIHRNLKPADVEYIRQVSLLTNVIPVLAKADLLSEEQKSAMKRDIAMRLKGAGIQPFSFTPHGSHDGDEATSPTIPYAVSSVTVSDHDIMDASLLMSPDYVQPLMPTDLGFLVERMFSVDGASWLRHSAAKKYLHWRDALPKPRHLYSPISPHEPNVSRALTRQGLEVARLSRQPRETSQPQYQVANWAADLQRSVATERARYEALARGERAIWLTEKLHECVQEGTLVAVSKPQEMSVRGRRSRRRSGGLSGSRQHQDPLGLLQVAAELKAGGWVALEVIGSLGILGGLAFWVTTRAWTTGGVGITDRFCPIDLPDMETTQPTWGMTAPISSAPPSQAELDSTNLLIGELRRQNTYETAAEEAKRGQVIKDIADIADEFVRRVAKEREPHNAVLIRDARGQVFTYGSYCLGVYGPGSDIDTLVTAPRYVTRDDYFKYFPGLLVEMTPPGAITDLTAVEDAFVPIIKFEFWGISIDLIFSRIATLTQFPPRDQLQLTNNEYLRGLDDRELRSLNGTRVTKEILNLVPEQATFRNALRAIKLWAQRRAIYANIIGFPGGVVWAMMVARVCQLYPKATAAVIVAKFFLVIKGWPWPMPIQLKHMDDGPLDVRVWNPKIYKADSYHLMPVITPAYPQMCATFNITHSNKAVIQRELERGALIAGKILDSKLPWKELFVKHTFFTKDHKYYLAVIITSTTKDAHKIWSGFVESKVRLLVGDLERHASVAVARPFNKGYDRQHMVKDETENQEVQNGSLEFLASDEDSAATEKSVKKEDTNDVQSEPATTALKTSPDAKSEVKPENEESKPDTITMQSTRLYTTTHYIGLELAEGAKSLDLSYQVNNFKALCTEWEKYQEELNFLSIQHVKNINLPNDVFEPGEAKPARPLKRPATNGTAAPSQKKRNAPSDGHPPPAKRPQPNMQASAAVG